MHPTQPSVIVETHEGRRSPVRTAAAYAVVALSPALAWLAWVSWSDGKPSDAMHVAWFVTVALGCVVAGGLAPRGVAHLVALAVLAVVATIVTLFEWWSREDSSGLFLVGIIIATPMVASAAPILLGLGRAIASRSSSQA